MIARVMTARALQRSLFAACAAPWLLVPAETPPAPAAAATEVDYVRFIEDEKGAQLQTAIATFAGPNGARVDLIGAVHVADKAYYTALNKLFTSYEAVLYELVGGAFEDRMKRASDAKDARLSTIGGIQGVMKDALGLHGQIEGVDYTAKNLVHADMGTRQFFDTQEKKGETFLGLWWKAVQAQMDAAERNPRADQPGLVKILEILCRKDSATELKRLVAREFDEIEAIIAGVETDGGTVILGERSRLTPEVLDRELARGRKKLAIFYGAAHLPDMESRLLAKGFRKTKVQWLTAWDLPPEPEPAPAKAEGQAKEPAPPASAGTKKAARPASAPR